VSGLRIDPLLVRLVGKLHAAFGETARAQLTGPLAAPVEDWSGRDVIEFVNRLRRETGDELMGLGASPCALGVSDLVIEICCRCATLRETMTLGARLVGIATSAVRIALIEEGDKAILQFTAEPSARDPDQALVDWLMIVWHKRSQWLIGSEIWLERTEFAHALDAHYSSYAAMFGGECVFNTDASRLVFPRSYLDRRIIRTPADGEHMKVWLPGYFGKPIGLSRTWKQLIKSVLRVEIANGEPPSTVDQLAVEFGVGSQTLRRRLKAEGASYRSLKAEARQEIAMDVLAAEGATLADASIAAGFAEPNALTRALKATRGISSTQLRDEVRRWSKAEQEKAERSGARKRPLAS
jgi:AraC-like DNA-binding protein